MSAGETMSLFGSAESSAEREQRLELLVREQFQFVWRTLRRFGLPGADADDAAQQVFLIAARKLANIEDGREKAFLFGTAINLAARFRRTVHRRQEVGDAVLADRADRGPGPEEALDKQRARELLDRILSEMSDPLRAVFVLHEVEQFSMFEIAGVLGIPPGTVASRLRRAREIFQRARAALLSRAPIRKGGAA